MSICLRKVENNGEWGVQFEIPNEYDDFHSQLNLAIEWFKAHGHELEACEYICDILFQHEKSDNIVFGYTLKPEQMKVFVDLNITLWLSRLRDEN